MDILSVFYEQHLDPPVYRYLDGHFAHSDAVTLLYSKVR